jgi:DNA-directed RNA polymerase subunit RPC12/RpoP
MTIPYFCVKCRHTFDRFLAFACPYCGQPAIINPECPKPLCPVDLVEPAACIPCKKKKSGGPRIGAGAPFGNLNHLVHGRRSDLLRHGIKRLVSDPSLHYMLIILAQFVLAGDFPPGTKAVFSRAVIAIGGVQHAETV